MEKKRVKQEAEEKRAKQEVEEKRTKAGERRLLAEHEAEKRKLLAESEAEERKAAMELEWLKVELEAKRLETAARPTGIVKEVVQRSVRIARSPELPAFVDGRNDSVYYLFWDLRDML